VNISGKLIENFIGLLYSKEFNTTFFSRELNLPSGLIDLIALLGQLKV
jgi:hypothetical protein